METWRIKKNLRREIRSEMRRTFGGDEGSARKSVATRSLVESLDRWFQETGQSVRNGGFWAFWPTLPEEPDFRDWLRRLIGEGVPIGLPRMDWDARMLDFRVVTDPERDLDFDTRGLAEPKHNRPRFEAGAVKHVLVPGLAFDPAGRRLGRGAGFYDRTLAGLAETAMTVGVAFDVQVVERVPVCEHDRPVRWLLTPEAGLRACRIG